MPPTLYRKDRSRIMFLAFDSPGRSESEEKGRAGRKAQGRAAHGRQLKEKRRRKSGQVRARDTAAESTAGCEMQAGRKPVTSEADPKTKMKGGSVSHREGSRNDKMLLLHLPLSLKKCGRRRRSGPRPRRGVIRFLGGPTVVVAASVSESDHDSVHSSTLDSFEAALQSSDLCEREASRINQGSASKNGTR